MKLNEQEMAELQSVMRQQIRRNRQVVFAVRGDNKLSLPPGLDAVALHELSHASLDYPNAAGQQLLPHLGPAVFLLDLGVDGLVCDDYSGNKAEFAGGVT